VSRVDSQEAEDYKALVRALEPVNGWVAQTSADTNRQRPQPGSPMKGDDDRLDPYQISHSCWHSLSHAVDHLHCLQVLVKDAGMIHMYGPYTLVRGALENACAAVWMLQPARRAERVERRLRFATTDIGHGEEARELTGQQGPRTKAERLDQVRQIARRCGVPEKAALRPASYKDIVRTASSGDPVIVLTWKLCSGIAHGDFWTTPAAAQMVPMASTAPPTVGAFAISAKVSLPAKMTTLAVMMTRLGWQLYDQRFRPPWAVVLDTR
jgi:hypothetical protein